MIKNLLKNGVYSIAIEIVHLQKILYRLWKKLFKHLIIKQNQWQCFLLKLVILMTGNKL